MYNWIKIKRQKWNLLKIERRPSENAKSKETRGEKGGLNKRAETGHWTFPIVQTSLLEQDPHKKKKKKKNDQKSGIRFDPVWTNQHCQFGA